MKTNKEWHIKFIILILTFSTIFQTCLTSSPISEALSSVFAQYIEKLTRLKRTEGVSTDNGGAESRDSSYGGSYGGGKGYGGGGYDGGGGGYGHGAITLDPVSIISLLALGAFLINNILQLLRANAAPAPAPAPMPPGRRSLNLDINVPLDLGSYPSVTGNMEYGDGKKGSNLARSNGEFPSEPSFSRFFENVGSLYYLHPKKRNICIKKVVCGYVNAQQSRETGQGTLKTRIFDLMLTTITKFVAPEISEDAKPELCHKFNKLCSDSLLQDAKISTENKVYGHVTTFISNFAMSNFMAG